MHLQVVFHCNAVPFNYMRSELKEMTVPKQLLFPVPNPQPGLMIDIIIAA